MRKNKDWLSPNNCNKAMCKTCIFRTDGNALELSPGRMNEIKGYLIGSSSHECHITKKTCFGALSFQAMIFYRAGLIAEDSVKCFLDTAARILNKKPLPEQGRR